MQKRLRLRKREDFSRVFKEGKAAANHQFVLYYMPSPDANPFRIGVSASKKIGRAVVRNRIRRRVKEIVRHMEQQVVPQMDIVLIIRKPAIELSHQELKNSLNHVFKRAGLLKTEKRREL